MFKRFSTACLGLGTFAVVALVEVATPQPTVEVTPEFVEKLLIEARAHSPAIAAAGARADAAAAAVDGVRTCPEHHYNVDSGVPLDRLFGRINISLSGQTDI